MLIRCWLKHKGDIMNERAPVFVKVDDYKDIADIVSLMREKITQAKFLLGKIKEIKSQEDAEIATWTRELDEVDARVINIDRTLAEPEQ